MHELSIALNIADLAETEAKRLGAVRVSAVHLRLGPLSGVVKDALLSAYDLACRPGLLEGSRLIIEEVPIQVYCPKCKRRRSLESMQSFCCPECHTPATEVLGGRELEVRALEIEP